MRLRNEDKRSYAALHKDRRLGIALQSQGSEDRRRDVSLREHKIVSLREHKIGRKYVVVISDGNVYVLSHFGNINNSYLIVVNNLHTSCNILWLSCDLTSVT
uniref:Uncharacterized protein n=1 Tax=Onchocerca volvulus TaxID=6282 RepID=A0A8R1TXI7_ONCVO